MFARSYDRVCWQTTYIWYANYSLSGSVSYLIDHHCFIEYIKLALVLSMTLLANFSLTRIFPLYSWQFPPLAAIISSIEAQLHFQQALMGTSTFLQYLQRVAGRWEAQGIQIWNTSRSFAPNVNLINRLQRIGTRYSAGVLAVVLPDHCATTHGGIPVWAGCKLRW